MTNERGFTLLEVLVATVIMAIAISGMLSALSGSTRNAARLSDYDRAAMLGRRKMDELLAERKLPRYVVLQGQWNSAATGGKLSGWRARSSPWEWSPDAGPGATMLERVELEVWWDDNGRRRTFTLEGFRRGLLTPADIAAGALLPK